MKQLLFCFVLAQFSLSLHAQQLTELNIDYMLRGHFYAQSSIEDTTAFGGFGGSDNAALRITSNLPLYEQGIILKIDTSLIVPLADKYKAYRFYLANQSDSILAINASDSRLPIVAEAYIKNEWQPIEYLPGSWCGNSYHSVYLKPKEYWYFTVPKFDGKIKTQVRYRLEFPNGKYIYSNTVAAGINRKQLSNKEGHKPQGIMDPYLD